MPNTRELDDNQIDQLKELVNLAMGDGAKALSSYTQRFVVLSVPQVNRLPLENLMASCRHLPAGATAYGVAQRFTCLGQDAQSLVVISDAYLRAFAQLTDRDCAEEADQEGLLVQLAGLINPVILPRLAKELKIHLNLGEITPLQPCRAGTLPWQAWSNMPGAYNLCFSYALEATSGSEIDAADPLASYRAAKADAPALGLDVIIRGPASLVQSLSEKFAVRIEV